MKITKYLTIKNKHNNNNNKILLSAISFLLDYNTFKKEVIPLAYRLFQNRK